MTAGETKEVHSASPAAAGANGSYALSVRDFGATGDGKTIDSTAINSAIDKAASIGGGTVIFPAGNYLCYSIHLKSNVSASRRRHQGAGNAIGAVR